MVLYGLAAIGAVAVVATGVLTVILIAGWLADQEAAAERP